MVLQRICITEITIYLRYLLNMCDTPQIHQHTETKCIRATMLAYRSLNLKFTIIYLFSCYVTWIIWGGCSGKKNENVELCIVIGQKSPYTTWQLRSIRSTSTWVTFWVCPAQGWGRLRSLITITILITGQGKLLITITIMIIW
jgi:hypothetical protein